MPAERFYVQAEYSIGATVCVIGNEHHHLSRVMRLSSGEEVELVNGNGSLARARIAEVEKEETSLEITSLTKTLPSPFSILAAVPLMRPSKLEWVIEKGTELGADGFRLYCAEYSEKNALSEHQIERLRQLSISALKQSGRLYLPSLEILASLESLLSYKGLILFGDPQSSTPFIPRVIEESILFISGPERGFSKNEITLLHQRGRSVRLNPNILRAETAPIAALSILGGLFYAAVSRDENPSKKIFSEL